jgi:predicted aspartyl protease/uncharacterized protein YecT (DUF1311 family)
MRAEPFSIASLFAAPISIAALAALSMLCGGSSAEAFECSGVTLPSSIVICSDPELMRLADERQQIYDAARARLTPEQRKQLLEDQRAWVHSYAAACGVPPNRPPPVPVPASVIECFKRAAEARAAYLRQYGLSADVMPMPPRDLSGNSGEPAYALAPPPVDEVPLTQEGGTFFIPVQINGAITLDFVIDSGAEDVQIPMDVFSTLIRAKTIVSDDIIGKQTYVLADGSTKEEPRFILRELKVGNQTLRNVTASVGPATGSLLLGQSFLSRFAAWTLDNSRHVLRLVEKSAEATSGNVPAVRDADQGGSSPAVAGSAPSREPQPYPETAFLCGRPVDYSLDRSGSDSEFLGVWSGSWNNSSRLCGGLIVERVRPDGAAAVIYVYGPSRPGSRLAWKEQHRMAFLSHDGRLSFQDDQGSLFAFGLVGSDLLQATFESRSGRLSGSFQRSR